MFLSLPDDDIIIADPEGEYYPLVNRLGGQVVRLSPSATAGTFINPMDINPNYADDEDPLSLKSDFILSLCELIVGGRSGLAPVEKTVIDRCVRTIYRPYLADPAPERMPILQDLYDELLKQSEPEARRVASALELYCTGSLNLFNHRTNVQVNSRLLCFDIKALGKMLKKIGLLILTDQIWGRVTENRDRRRATWVYQDEFHVLLAEPQTAAYSVEIFRRFRKWGAIPSGITQNVKSLLESSEIESIFGNCDFLYMLSQAAGDQKVLASHLGISPPPAFLRHPLRLRRGAAFLWGHHHPLCGPLPPGHRALHPPDHQAGGQGQWAGVRPGLALDTVSRGLGTSPSSTRRANGPGPPNGCGRRGRSGAPRGRRGRRKARSRRKRSNSAWARPRRSWRPRPRSSPPAR